MVMDQSGKRVATRDKDFTGNKYSNLLQSCCAFIPLRRRKKKSKRNKGQEMECQVVCTKIQIMELGLKSSIQSLA